MNEDVSKKLAELELKLTRVERSLDLIRKYFLVTLVVTLVLFILPLIALVFVLPSFLNTYLGSLGQL